MILLIGIWFFFAVLVALFGAFRKIGFAKSLLASVLLTPLIGIIVTALSKSNKAINKKAETDRLSREYLDLIDPKK